MPIFLHAELLILDYSSRFQNFVVFIIFSLGDLFLIFQISCHTLYPVFKKIYKSSRFEESSA